MLLEHHEGQSMGILKRRRKDVQSDDYMWLDRERVEQPPSAPPAEEAGPSPEAAPQFPPAPPPPVPVEATSQPEEGSR
jgi:hypothetical protein